MKITDLREKRYKTINKKGADGNNIEERVEYITERPVKLVTDGKRFAHFFIDLIVIQILFYILQFFLNLFSNPKEIFSVVLTFGIFSLGLISLMIYPLYYVIFEHFWQKTPGKFITKSIVIDEEGNKPDLQTNILRNIVRLVPFEIFSCFEGRGWHDKWSDTYVISDEEFSTIKKLLDEEKKEE